MAAKVLKELAVAVSTYEDRNTGQTKNRYKNIGVLMQTVNDQGEKNTFLMLDRSFNPAGVQFKPGSDKILISMFDPRPRDGDQRQGGQGGGQGHGSGQGGGYGGGYDQGGQGQYDGGHTGSRDIDDSEIPF